MSISRRPSGALVQAPGAGPAMRRPRLRGWSHLVASVPWAVGTVALVILASGHVGRQFALLGYGVASVVLFATSGIYHVRTWSPRHRALLRRLDHGNIFLLVAATYTPIVLTVLSGAWKVTLISTVWGLAGLGIVLAVTTLRTPRWLLAGSYLLLGWVAIIALPVITAAVGIGGLVLLLVAGVLYTVGAILYATRWPDLVPGWFGYHELFHVLVIAANAVFFGFMVAEVARHH